MRCRERTHFQRPSFFPLGSAVRSAGGAAFCLGLLGLLGWGVVWGQKKTAGEAEGTASTPAVTSLETTGASRPPGDELRRAFSRQLYFQEREETRLFDYAVRQLRAGRTVEGLRHLQRLLDVPQDRFTWRNQSVHAMGQRQQVLHLLAGLPPAQQALYQRLYAATAARLLQKAVRLSDEAPLREVLRRFPLTPAGFQAGHRLALRCFDEGNYGEALSLWQFLQQWPVHRERFSTELYWLMAVAARNSGRRAEAARLIRKTGGESLRLGGRRFSSKDFLSRSPAVTPEAGDNWPLPLGTATGNQVTDVSPPFPEVLWSVRYESSGRQIAQAASNRWQRERRSAGQSSAVVNTPLVMGGQVIVRDFGEVQAIELRTGRKLWNYICQSSLTNSLQSAGVRPVGSRTPLLGQRGRLFSAGQMNSFDNLFARNEVLGTMTSDGRRVFLIDDVFWGVAADRNRPRFPARRPRQGAAVNTAPPWNRLVALSLEKDHSAAEDVGRKANETGEPKNSAQQKEQQNGQQRRPLWAVGGPPAKTNTSALAGFFFLGPPLPVNGRLYVLGESRQQLSLICLNPADGTVVFRQALAYVDETFSLPHRRLFAATPVFGRGVLVFPTRTGFLMGVETATGSLLWAVPLGDVPAGGDIFTWNLSMQASLPRGNFLSSPVIEGNRVLMLSPLSRRLFCLDLHSGEILWTIPRDDAEYIGAVDEETVLLVGRRRTRGLSLQDGQLQWSTHTGIPSGRGLAAGKYFLLPLEAGRILMLERRTGHKVGFSLPGLIRSAAVKEVKETDGWRPGNLVPAGSFILSAETDRLRVFPQAKTVLVQAEQQLQRNPQSAALHFRAARLSLLLGNLQEADRLLTAALPLFGQQTAGHYSAEQYEESRRLLRELLYLRLRQRGENTTALLRRIDDLSHEPAARARFLMERAEFERQRGDLSAMLSTLDEFAGLNVQRLFPHSSGEAHLVSLSAWAAELLRKTEQEGGAGAVQLRRHLLQRRSAALASKGIDTLEHFLAVFGSRNEAASARNEFARRLQKRGHLQRAELLLLQNHSSGDLSTAAAAGVLLISLWTGQGLHEQAARMLAECETRFADVVLPDGRTGQQFADDWKRRHRLSGITLERLRGPKTPVAAVTITEDRWLQSDPVLAGIYSNFRQFFRTPRHSAYDLLDLGKTAETQLTVVDRNTGVVVGRLNIPARFSYPAQAENAFVGRYFSLGSFGRMYGISLLELQDGKPLWSARPQGFENRDDMLLAGPAGPGFAVFQAHEDLIVVDPGTGRLLWQRSDLLPSSGLHSDPYSGLFGDEHVLVVLGEEAHNILSYTIYETRTGVLLRQGRLKVSRQHERRLFGRLLVYVEPRGGRLFLRIWDPWSNRHLLEFPLQGKFHFSVSDRSSLVVLMGSGELLLLDVPAGRVRRLPSFSSAELANLSYLKTFREGDRLFVNVQRPVPVNDRFFSFYAGDTFMPAQHIRGELYAFDCNTGRRLWKRTFPQRTVLQPRNGKLPFLVMVSRIRDRNRGTRASLLVEVLDADTGRTLGRRDNLYPDRLLHMQYHPQEKAVVLRGILSTIRLKLWHRLPGGIEETDAF